MKIAIIENNQILSHGEHTEVFPNVSFPPEGLDLMWAQERNAYQIQSDKAHSQTEKLTFVEPYIEGGVVFDVIVEAKTQDELDAEKTQKANEVRYRRNALLTQSDWTQVADVQVDKAIWAEYRQALRDITLQEGFPFDIIWPSQHKSIPVESSIPAEVPVNIPEEISISEEPVIDIPAGSSDSIDSINIL
jgi:hypothetical protein